MNYLIIFFFSFSLQGKEARQLPAQTKIDKKMDHSKDHDHGDHKGHDHKHEEQKAKIAKNEMGEILVKVQGMVCAFCAQGIKKNFNKRKEVEKTEVDLDKMEVRVTLKKGKSLDKNTIEKIVTGAGFKMVGVQ